jgi:hypothetical protein
VLMLAWATNLFERKQVSDGVQGPMLIAQAPLVAKDGVHGVMDNVHCCLRSWLLPGSLLDNLCYEFSLATSISNDIIKLLQRDVLWRPRARALHMS